MMTQLLEPLEIRQPFRSRLDELAQSYDSVLVVVEQSEDLLHDDLGLSDVGVVRCGSSFGRVVVESVWKEQRRRGRGRGVGLSELLARFERRGRIVRSFRTKKEGGEETNRLLRSPLR